MEWNDRFTMLFRETVERYHLRPQTPTELFFLPEELEFLEGIGYSAAEMHGYVREYATQGEPSPTTVLLIAAVRRSFFLTQLRGISAAQIVPARELPPESETYQDIPYLPRLIRKATLKLHGTLDPHELYANEKDRQFLREHGEIHPADFLYLTWFSHGELQKIVQHVVLVTPVVPAASTPEESSEDSPAAEETASS